MQLRLHLAILLVTVTVATCKVLNEDSFEHDTQASTGATTGDWLVKFFHPQCQTCIELAPVWEEVETQLAEMKLQGMGANVNVAEVNIEESPALMERFGIKAIPSILLFRHNKMYTYAGENTQKEIVHFATEGFQSVQGITVPKEKTFVDKIIEKVMGLFGQGKTEL
eukprot:TRINITY_DN19512_c0_g1_i1.p1 TRINITY_DN19512_c0_g1~~TRINITY_DN19512_c0_g1_i1.p1  ORF type:complete len:190 (-),score=28.11 TRINITY_DN19512_c0_g1_i1:128-628(-)